MFPVRDRDARFIAAFDEAGVARLREPIRELAGFPGIGADQRRAALSAPAGNALRIMQNPRDYRPSRRFVKSRED
jgi:hypothetical protein